jgi:hypothetical protein
MNTWLPLGSNPFRRSALAAPQAPAAGRCAAALGDPIPPSPWYVALLILGLGLALLPLAGCNMLAAFQFILQGEPTVDPAFTALEDHKVVVVCHAPARIRYSFDSVDTDLAKAMSRLLELNAEDVEVVEPDAVASWLDKHGNWSDVTEIGKAFEADYVIFADVQQFSIYEENSPNMLRGRAYVDLRVYDVNDDGEVVFEADIESIYPLGRPLPVGEKRERSFRREYVARLADELGRHFYPYVAGEDVKLF